MKQLNEIPVRSVVKILGMHSEKKQFYLISKYYAKNSLQDLIDSFAKNENSS